MVEPGKAPEKLRGRQNRWNRTHRISVYDAGQRQEIPPDTAVPGKTINTRNLFPCEKGMAHGN